MTELEKQEHRAQRDARVRAGGFPDRYQTADMDDAHAEGLHDGLPREGCPSCESQRGTGRRMGRRTR